MKPNKISARIVSKFRLGCPFGLLASQMNVPPKPVKRTIRLPIHDMILLGIVCQLHYQRTHHQVVQKLSRQLLIRSDRTHNRYEMKDNIRVTICVYTHHSIFGAQILFCGSWDKKFLYSRAVEGLDLIAT